MLKGKTAIVTGSTAGIGRGIARALAREGAEIFVAGLPQDDGKAIASSLADEFGARTSFLCADLTKPATAAQLVTRAEEDLGPVDILVNNAGIRHMAPLEEFPVNKWDETIALNLSAPFHMTRLVVKGMKQRSWGRIINIASTLGLVAAPSKVAYVAAKHGLIGLTKATALETADQSITCNAICPGYVRDSHSVEHPANSEPRSRHAPVAGSQLPANFITVDQVGALCVFLCGDQAGSITGAALSIDGGLTAK